MDWQQAQYTLEELRQRMLIETPKDNPPSILIKPLVTNSIIRNMIVYEYLEETFILFNKETTLEIQRLIKQKDSIALELCYSIECLGICKDIALFDNKGIPMFLTISNVGIASFLKVYKNDKIWDISCIRELVTNSVESEYQHFNRKLAIEPNKQSFALSAWLNEFTVYMMQDNLSNEVELEMQINNLIFKEFKFQVPGLIWNMDYLYMEPNVKERKVLVLIYFDENEKFSTLSLFEFICYPNPQNENISIDGDNGNQRIEWQNHKLPLGDMSSSADGLPLHLIPLYQIPDAMIIISENQIMFLQTENVISGDVHFPRLEIPKIPNRDEIPFFTSWVEPAAFKKTFDKNYLYLASDEGYLYRLDILTQSGLKSRNYIKQVQLKLTPLIQIKNSYLGNNLVILERKQDKDLLAYSADFSDGGIIWVNNKLEENDDNCIVSPYLNSQTIDCYYDDIDEFELSPNSKRGKKKKSRNRQASTNIPVQLNSNFNLLNWAPIIDLELIPDTLKNLIRYKKYTLNSINKEIQTILPKSKLMTCSGIFSNGSLTSFEYGCEAKLINSITSKGELNEIDEFSLDQNELVPLSPLNTILDKIDAFEIKFNQTIHSYVVFYTNYNIRLLQLVGDDLVDITEELNLLQSEHTINLCPIFDKNYILQVTNKRIIYYELLDEIEQKDYIAKMHEYDFSDMDENILFSSAYGNLVTFIKQNVNSEYTLCVLEGSIEDEEMNNIYYDHLRYPPSCIFIIEKEFINSGPFIMVGTFDSKVLIYTFLNNSIKLIGTLQLNSDNDELNIPNSIIAFNNFLMVGLKDGTILCYQCTNDNSKDIYYSFKNRFLVGILPVTFKKYNNYLLCFSDQLFIIQMNNNFIQNSLNFSNDITMEKVIFTNSHVDSISCGTILNLNTNKSNSLYILLANEHSFNLQENSNSPTLLFSPILKPHHKQSPKNSPKTYQKSSSYYNNKSKSTHLAMLQINLSPKHMTSKLLVGGTPRRIYYDYYLNKLLLFITEQSKNTCTSYIRLVHPKNGTIFAQHKLYEHEEALTCLLWETEESETRYKALYFVGIGEDTNSGKYGRVLAILIESDNHNIKLSVLTKLEVPMGGVSCLVRLGQHLVIGAGKSVQVMLPSNGFIKSFSFNIKCTHTLDSPITHLSSYGNQVAVSSNKAIYLFEFRNEQLNFINQSQQLRNYLKLIFIDEEYGIAFDKVGNLCLLKLKNHLLQGFYINQTMLTGLKEVDTFYFIENISKLELLNISLQPFSAIGCTMLGSVFQLCKIDEQPLLFEFQQILVRHHKVKPLLGNDWHALRKKNSEQYGFLDGFIFQKFLQYSQNYRMFILKDSNWDWDIKVKVIQLVEVIMATN